MTNLWNWFRHLESFFKSKKLIEFWTFVWTFSQSCGIVCVTKVKAVTNDTVSIEKHLSESEREGIQGCREET